MLRETWVKIDESVKTSSVNLLNKAFEYNLKHIIEENIENSTNSIKVTLEKN